VHKNEGVIGIATEEGSQHTTIGTDGPAVVTLSRIVCRLEASARVVECSVDLRQLQGFRYFNGGFKLSISSCSQYVSRQFNTKLGNDTVVFEHPPLPRQVSGNR
jgi:hypothetical protein